MNKLPCPRRRSGEVIEYDSLTSPTVAHHVDPGIGRSRGGMRGDAHVISTRPGPLELLAAIPVQNSRISSLHNCCREPLPLHNMPSCR